MKSGFDYSMGNLQLEFIEMAKGKFDEQHFKLDYNPEKTKKIPVDVSEGITETIARKEEEARRTGGSFFDGQLVGVYGLRVENEILEIDAYPTTYFTYVGSNQSLDKQLPDGKTIREKYIEDPRNLDDILANPIGVSAITITDDDMCFYAKRSEKLGTFPNRYGIAPAGFMERNDLIDGVPSPFATIKREGEEELLLEGKLNFEITGFGRSRETMHSEVYGTLRTDMTSKEIMTGITEHIRDVEESVEKKKKLKKTVKTFDITRDLGVEENVEKYFVEFKPEEVIKRKIFANANDMWVHAHAVAVINALYNEWPERVEKLLREL